MVKRRRRSGTSHKDNHSASCETKTVAIIGGSFAGLSLACALQKNFPEHLHVTVIEARSKDRYIDMITGELNLHGLDRHLLKELSLNSLYEQLVRSDACPSIVQRHQLLRGLEKSLFRGTVLNSCRLSSVTLHSSGKLSLDLESNSCNLDRKRFDYLVLAYGLSPKTDYLIPPKIAHRVAVIGDARVQFGYELFFGMARINYGATSSIKDGVEFAAVLASAAVQKSGLSKEEYYGMYSVAYWQKTRRLLRIGIAVVGASFIALCVVFG